MHVGWLDCDGSWFDDVRALVFSVTNNAFCSVCYWNVEPQFLNFVEVVVGSVRVVIQHEQQLINFQHEQQLINFQHEQQLMLNYLQATHVGALNCLVTTIFFRDDVVHPCDFACEIFLISGPCGLMIRSMGNIWMCSFSARVSKRLSWRTFSTKSFRAAHFIAFIVQTRKVLVCFTKMFFQLLKMTYVSPFDETP